MVDILFKCLDALESYVDNIKRLGTSSEGDEGTTGILLISFLQFQTKAKLPWETGPVLFRRQERKKDDLHLGLNIYDRNVLEKAFEESLNVFEIYIELDRSRCLLKAARAFIIFKISHEKHSDIIKS